MTPATIARDEAPAPRCSLPPLTVEFHRPRGYTRRALHLPSPTGPVRTILLVKTSSLGDVVHNLPVVGDLQAIFPDAAIDWLVEETLADIPRMHPGVRRVFTCAVRRWRRTLFQYDTWREIDRLRESLRLARYDAVIDTQGLLKSAVLAHFASGTRHGLDWRSSREPLRLFYDRTHRVPWGQHAVARNRSLAAQALGYDVPAKLDYGIVAPALPKSRPADDEPPAWLADGASFSWLPARPLGVFLHATSADSKLWPEHQWKKLAAHFVNQGLAIALPWGNDDERARAERIASKMRHVIVAPRMGIRALATLFGESRICIGVDTGLTHLAAALGRPTVGIYVDTDPAATGVLAPGNAVNIGSRREVPSLNDVLAAVNAVL